MPLLPRAVKVAELPGSLSFSGQVILVTGGNSGLGLAAAIHYVQRGASTVIITTRNAARGAEARETIESLTGKKGVVQVRILDINTFASVKDFVDSLKRDVKSIDIVLLNAGCVEFTYTKSPDGWETDLQINTLSTTLLSLLLIPWMRSIQRGIQHLTIVGSSSHREVDILASSFPKHQVLKYWNDENNYKPAMGAYTISKLLLHYAALEIAKLAENADGRYAVYFTRSRFA
jgi:NAD(P)-dependent dehydrogenase (short-subunit alcohol dehydrogenase family)